jgi:ATP-dependent Zn protease
VAEEIVFEDVSTDAENDFEQATELARQMVVRCGMSAKLGLANFSGDTPAILGSVLRDALGGAARARPDHR